MPKLSILVLSGALVSLCATGDTIHASASANRSHGIHLRFERGGTGFSSSESVWDLRPGDFTEVTDATHPAARNAWVASDSDDKGHWINTAPLIVPADVTPVPEPGTLGLIAVGLATSALMRRKRLV